MKFIVNNIKFKKVIKMVTNLIDDDLEQIEINEVGILNTFGWIFKNSLNEFRTSIDRSLGYLDKIILPMIMASKKDKSYNPFAEIIEKYAIHILTNKLEKEGYKLLPLGYSADLTLEKEDHILSIDIKTANLENSSDFKGTINVGINQLTHVSKLPISRKNFLPGPFYVYPTIPTYYTFPDGRKKYVFTYGLMFIYPSYSNLMEDIREEYNNIQNFFKDKVEGILIDKFARFLNKDKEIVKKILNSKPEKSAYTKEELIIENIIRGIFINEAENDELQRELDITPSEREKINNFSNKIKEFSNKLREMDLKPIAIVAIAIPNGLLKDKYLDKFVSGKDYAKSTRYHYEDGIFEIIKERSNKIIPRVIFLSYDENYLKELKKNFKKISILDLEIKEI